MVYQDILKTEEAKKNFIKGMVRLAKADGEIAQEEQNYYMTAAVGLELSEESMEEIRLCMTSEDLISISFDSEEEALLFLREGIQLCAVDESYAENERTEIRVMAAELNIPESQIDKMEAWVQEGMEWKHRGDALLSL